MLLPLPWHYYGPVPSHPSLAVAPRSSSPAEPREQGALSAGHHCGLEEWDCPQREGTLHEGLSCLPFPMSLVRLLPSSPDALLSLLKLLPWDKFIFQITGKFIPGLYLPSRPPPFPQGSVRFHWSSLSHLLVETVGPFILIRILGCSGHSASPPHLSISLPIRISGLSFPKPFLYS